MIIFLSVGVDDMNRVQYTLCISSFVLSISNSIGQDNIWQKKANTEINVQTICVIIRY